VWSKAAPVAVTVPRRRARGPSSRSGSRRSTSCSSSSGDRGVHFGGCTATRDGGWVTQQARRASRANAYAERWVRTMRTECLDWLLIWNRTYLERVRRVYVCDYNHQRPHRGLGLAHLRGRIRCPHYLGGARRGVSARPPRGSAPRVLPGRGVNRDLCTLQVEGTQSQRRRVSGNRNWPGRKRSRGAHLKARHSWASVRSVTF